MRFQIAFLRSPATPSGEALDAAIAAAFQGLEQRRDDGTDYVRLPDGNWVAFWREAGADWFFVLSPVTTGDGLSALVLDVAERTAAMFTIDFSDDLFRPRSAEGLEPLLGVPELYLCDAPDAKELEDILLRCIAQFAALEATEAEALREGLTLPVFEELALAQRDGVQPLSEANPIVEAAPEPGIFQKLSDTLFGKKV
jgi:hypothetical protein